MKTIYRYTKDTIRNQEWETIITDNNDGTYDFDEIHLRRDYYKVIKQISKKVNKDFVERYMKENQKYLIEEYKTN